LFSITFAAKRLEQRFFKNLSIQHTFRFRSRFFAAFVVKILGLDFNFGDLVFSVDSSLAARS